MCLCSGSMTWIDLSETANHILGPGAGPSAGKVSQAWSHLVLGFSSTSSWPVPASLTVEPTQVLTAPAHQTPFTHMQLDTFLGHHPTEEVVTKPSLLSLQDIQTQAHIEESNRKLEALPPTSRSTQQKVESLLCVPTLLSGSKYMQTSKLL